ncbi:MAG TPA: glycosyltransferase [Candidatus Paceibacterota bacterium]
MKEKIYIILPVHNRKDTTSKFINCLKKQTYTNYHLILIDDGSNDGTDELVRNQIPYCTIIRGNGNWWWGGSLQQGYLWLKKCKMSDNDIVLIINDDTTFESDFLQNAVDILKDKTKCLIQAYAYSSESNLLIDKGTHVDWENLTFNRLSDGNDINCLSTRGLFLKLNDFIALKGFYPKLLPHYASDYAFTIRAFNKKYKLISDIRLKIISDESLTGLRKMEPKSIFNRISLIFSKKYVLNPIYFTVFLLFSCPLKYLLKNTLKIWYGALKQLTVLN